MPIPSITFAVSFHPQLMQTSQPRETIHFIGQSLPYYDQVRAALAAVAMAYTALPLRSADLELYTAVHDQVYLTAIQQASQGELATPALLVSAECAGLEYALPGYAYSLGGLCTAIDLMRQGNLERAHTYRHPSDLSTARMIYQRVSLSWSSLVRRRGKCVQGR